MKTYLDTEANPRTVTLAFDERDAALDENARALISAAHAAGLASCNALVQLKRENPDADPVARELAVQIFAQSLGISFGLTFGESSPVLFAQVITCARLVTMSPDERDDALEKIAELTDKAMKARH